MTSVLSADVLESYIQLPDMKFILAEREPLKWARSINSQQFLDQRPEVL